MKGLARAQGAFYVVTGLWPIVHMRSFEAVSGRKKEKWLVKTMGALIAAVGGALLIGAKTPRPTRALGLLSAAALAACDVIYAGSGRIAKTYLADAAVESGFVMAWLGTPSGGLEAIRPARVDRPCAGSKRRPRTP